MLATQQAASFGTLLLFAPMPVHAADMALRVGTHGTGSVSLFQIFKVRGAVLFEYIFVGVSAFWCLAQPRKREANRLMRLKTRAHEGRWLSAGFAASGL